MHYCVIFRQPRRSWPFWRMLCGRSLYPHAFTWQLGSPPPSLNPASIKVQLWMITCIRWIRRFITTTTVEMERLTIQSSNIKSNHTVSNLFLATGRNFFPVRLANLNTTFLLSFFLTHIHGALYKDILIGLCHPLQWHRDMVLRRHKLIIWEKHFTSVFVRIKHGYSLSLEWHHCSVSANEAHW